MSIEAFGTGTVIPTPRCLPGGETGEIIPIQVTVEGFTDPAEILHALMMFGQAIAQGIEEGALPSNLKKDAGESPVDFYNEAKSGAELGGKELVKGPMPGVGGLCEEHAAEVANAVGGKVVSDMERFLADLDPDEFLKED